MLSIEGKKEIIKKYGKDENDTGSSRVQVALLTARISYLTEHFKEHKHDHHSRLGLMKLVGSRRRMLGYIKKKDIAQYRDLIKDLGLRK